MIIKIYRIIHSSFYWAKAIKHSSKKEFDEAIRCLECCTRHTLETYSTSLLGGYLLFVTGKHKEAIEKMNLALMKIEKSKSLNDDEKKYLTAYASDIINRSIVGGRFDASLVPVDTSFNSKNVAEHHKNNFYLCPLK